MADTTVASLTGRVTPVAAGEHVVACAFLKRTPAFARADGVVLLAEIGAESLIAAHPGAGLLVAASDGERLVTGGDDGRVVATDAAGRVSDIGSTGGKWIDALAIAPSGAVAWSAGRAVTARDDKGTLRTWTAPSSVRGLAFAPKGYRLMAAHYNGASLWFPNTAAPPEAYEWKGSHLDATFSPDGRFIVTSMQENTLHGWRVADRQHMRMSGYPSKTRSFSWSHDGAWLATSGADAAIVWPFEAKDGPMGKAPRECGVRAAKVSRVAFHPKALVLAVGYDDGCILLCRLSDAAEVLVRPAVDGSGITALAWDRSGAQLAFGCDDGQAGVLTLPSG